MKQRTAMHSNGFTRPTPQSGHHYFPSGTNEALVGDKRQDAENQANTKPGFNVTTRQKTKAAMR